MGFCLRHSCILKALSGTVPQRPVWAKGADGILKHLYFGGIPVEALHPRWHCSVGWSVWPVSFSHCRILLRSLIVIDNALTPVRARALPHLWYYLCFLRQADAHLDSMYNLCHFMIPTKDTDQVGDVRKFQISSHALILPYRLPPSHAVSLWGHLLVINVSTDIDNFKIEWDIPFYNMRRPFCLFNSYPLVFLTVPVTVCFAMPFVVQVHPCFVSNFIAM